MDTLYNASAKRAGGRITIKHSTGKIAGIDTIEVKDGQVIATHMSGVAYRLETNSYENGLRAGTAG